MIDEVYSDQRREHQNTSRKQGKDMDSLPKVNHKGLDHNEGKKVLSQRKAN